MEWSDELSVGIKIIDNQHKEILNIVNRAYEINPEEDNESAEKVFNELIDISRVHFTTEENYFKECEYPGAEEHIAEHVKLMQSLLEFQSNFQNKNKEWSTFLEFLKGWLKNHLAKVDRLYIENFKECGLE